jgi:uncharacterized protein YaiE (UPF0345 family)
MGQYDEVSVLHQANVYAQGRCISHTVLFPDGRKKTLGVILPSCLSFHTGVAEVMETVCGQCRYRIADGPWMPCGEGQRFSVPADTDFEIEVSEHPYHYICHFD